MGAMPLQEREALVSRMKASRKTPLSHDTLLSLARLSPRQLLRLPKSSMTRHDRLIVKALQEQVRKTVKVL